MREPPKPSPGPLKGPERLLTAAEQKIAQLEEQIKELEANLGQSRDNYLRAVADLDNYKKRMVREREELIQFTTERLLRELLDVKDHLELAIDHSKEAADIKSLRDGVTLTLRQLGQFLEKFGVTELSTLGEKFDPAFHEAVHEEEGGDFQPGSVVKEYQRGYLYQGRLLRAARVAVAKVK